MSTINSNSNSQHQDIVDSLRPLAMAIPANSVRLPEIPIATFIDEGLGFVSAGREHKQALEEVGMDGDLIDSFEQSLFGLQAVQGQWNKERNKGRAEAAITIIEKTADLRSEALAMADLALRNSGEGQRRLSGIREGEGLADQVADLLDLALLFRDANELFATVKIDASDMASKLEAGSSELQNALAKEDAQKSLCIT